MSKIVIVIIIRMYRCNKPVDLKCDGCNRQNKNFPSVDAVSIEKSSFNSQPFVLVDGGVLSCVSIDGCIYLLYVYCHVFSDYRCGLDW
jgi:hypothetical protein